MSPVASPTIPHAMLQMTSKTDNFPLETEPVAHDNNMIFKLKPGVQTSVTPDSTDNQNTQFMFGKGYPVVSLCPLTLNFGLSLSCVLGKTGLAPVL